MNFPSPQTREILYKIYKYFNILTYKIYVRYIFYMIDTRQSDNMYIPFYD